MSEPTRPRHLSDTDLARLRQKLEDVRSTWLAAERATLREQRSAEAEPGDPADLAEQTIEHDASLRLATFDNRLLAEVERALAKLDAGTYGLSEDSGEPIELARLEAVPWARRTAEEEERHQLELGEARHATA
ncbi:MAG: chaperone protein ClpB-like [Myxococcales bacterium]|nr:chaperone protein ClpB-like [Myxococcales bacterium]